MAAPDDHGLFSMFWIPSGDGRGGCPGKSLVRLVSILEAAVFEQALGCERVQQIQNLLPIRTVNPKPIYKKISTPDSPAPRAHMLLIKE